MDSCAHWPQGIGDSTAGEKKPRPGKEHALNCPRCNSTNTKFCYYNNYSLSQPRYLCKACRRYWTHGGSLRNVPVGGGTRRSRKSYSSSSSSSTSSAKNRPCVGVVNLVPENLSAQIQNQNPRMMIHHDGHDLNLACNSDQYSTMGMPEFVNFDDQNPIFAAAVHQIPARELLKAGSFVVPSMVYESEGGGLLGFKQGPRFSGDRINGMINGFGHSPAGVEDHRRHHANSAATDLFFPFGDHVMMKEAAATGDPPLVHGKGETGGFWSGMLAGGSSR